MHTSQAVDKIVLRQHDFPNTREQLRLMLFHPEQLGRCKAGKRDVSRARAEHRAPHRIVQPGCFFGGTAVVPQNGRAQHRVRFIQRNKAVHLAAHAHAAHLPRVKAGQQLRHALPARRPPIPGVLLAPARMWEAERIFFGNGIPHTAFFIYQKKLAGRSAKVDTNIQHRHTSCCLFQYTAAAPCSL